ncbi:hypothetical protein D3C86_2231100 [compost metagenome]
MRGTDVGLVDTAHDAVKRQHHERQQDMRHGDDRAVQVVHQIERLIDDAETAKNIVENAV